jgi:hypothetical protein
LTKKLDAKFENEVEQEEFLDFCDFLFPFLMFFVLPSTNMGIVLNFGVNH